ncbi:RNA methyltransferase, RsmD family [Aeromicrobium marinum DSM 15272]|uniref:RNA methyltransferase, RsmD family n=1 Tax=Aeromicrobium marinum DSM 15272 TaxID=585531 RepID=E2SAZ1_9ACTN|nr:16S rRNA (guanine(966)-N(2))-methyltransferase RsmD [Aeromicrobium marinum]EFQ83537.1 RNA methyltransferase, RsmD family [Aeromicrobium marinum DSM 15272]
MTRIVAGRFKGRRLHTPAGDVTRPTSDRVRESLFASLVSEFGGLEGLRVLDLFAGSGAIGLEAVSRGATLVDLVEHDRRAVQVVRRNATDLGAGVARVHLSTAQRFLRTAPAEPYHLVVLDPPYGMATQDVTGLVEVLADPSWCVPDGLLVVERSTRDPFVWPASVTPLRDRAYGETTLWYGR